MKLRQSSEKFYSKIRDFGRSRLPNTVSTRGLEAARDSRQVHCVKQRPTPGIDASGISCIGRTLENEQLDYESNTGPKAGMPLASNSKTSFRTIPGLEMTKTASPLKS